MKMPPKKGKSKSKIKGSRSTESAGPSAQSSEGGETLQESPPDPYMNTLPAGIEVSVLLSLHPSNLHFWRDLNCTIFCHSKLLEVRENLSRFWPTIS